MSKKVARQALKTNFLILSKKGSDFFFWRKLWVIGIFFLTAEFFVALPEILAISAAVTHFHVALTAIPVYFAVLIILTTPAAVPGNFQKISALDFFNDQSHRHQIFFDVISLHQLIEFINFIVSTIKVDDENFFCKYR